MHGWELRVLPNITDHQLAQILGTNRKEDFVAHEHESVDILALVTPRMSKVPVKVCPCCRWSVSLDVFDSVI